MGDWVAFLPISFHPVVGLAEHLAVLDICCTAVGAIAPVRLLGSFLGSREGFVYKLEPVLYTKSLRFCIRNRFGFVYEIHLKLYASLHPYLCYRPGERGG